MIPPRISLFLAFMMTVAVCANAQSSRSEGRFTSVNQISSYCMELDETLGGGEEGGDAGRFTIRMERVRPALGPQQTEVEFRYVEIGDEDKPWELHPILLRATVTGNLGPRSVRIEYTYEGGALLRCSSSYEASELKGTYYYYQGDKTLALQQWETGSARSFEPVKPSKTAQRAAAEFLTEGRLLHDIFLKLAKTQDSIDKVAE
jgi:hypothetical protein